jgi:hypothetical protein
MIRLIVKSLKPKDIAYLSCTNRTLYKSCLEDRMMHHDSVLGLQMLLDMISHLYSELKTSNEKALLMDKIQRLSQKRDSIKDFLGLSLP